MSATAVPNHLRVGKPDSHLVAAGVNEDLPGLGRVALATAHRIDGRPKRLQLSGGYDSLVELQR